MSGFCISLLFLQFVFLTFWGIFAIDRELVYPANMDLYIPVALNHYWVRMPLSTFIVVTQVGSSASSVYHSLSSICFCTPNVFCICIQEVRWSTKYSCKVCYICVFQWNMNAFAVHNFCLLVPNRASDIITSPLRIVTLLGDSLHYQVLRRVPRWCSSIVFSSHPTQHSAIAVTVLIEMFLVYHKYPSTSTALLILFGFCTGYVVW